MTASNDSMEVDVLVVGGGPAGAAAATFLQRRGHRCLIAEKASFPRYHIGESLIPHTFGVMDRLGVLDKLRESAYPEKYSVRFVPESGSEGSPFYFDETIPGEGARTWQVERSSFDVICLSNARDAGVDVREETRVVKVLFDGDTACGAVLQGSDGGPQEVRSKVVIDASGRTALLGTQLGLRESVPGLHKASIWGYFKGGHRFGGKDAGETTIYKTAHNGWFWYIPLPDDEVSVGIVGDPEHVLPDGMESHDAFMAAIDQCRPLKMRLAEASLVGRVHVLKELAYLHRQGAGNGWIMIGDSAAFLDPVYSSGLYLALASAELAAESIHKGLEIGDVSASVIGAHRPALLAGVEVIRRLIYAFYDPIFSFGDFAARHPELRAQLIDCLVGDVVGKDMSALLTALEAMTPPPEPLNIS